MSVAKLFTHGGSQAVRLPKDYRFAGTEVHVRRVGDEVILSPRPAAGFQALVDALALFDRSAPLVRDQPSHEQAETRRPFKPVL